MLISESMYTGEAVAKWRHAEAAKTRATEDSILQESGPSLSTMFYLVRSRTSYDSLGKNGSLDSLLVVLLSESGIPVR